MGMAEFLVEWLDGKAPTVIRANEGVHLDGVMTFYDGPPPSGVVAIVPMGEVRVVHVVHGSQKP